MGRRPSESTDDYLHRLDVEESLNKRFEGLNSGIGCVFIIAMAVSLFLLFWTNQVVQRNRGDICDLRLAGVTTEADSAAIYNEEWPWYLLAALNRCPRDTPSPGD